MSRGIIVAWREAPSDIVSLPNLFGSHHPVEHPPASLVPLRGRLGSGCQSLLSERAKNLLASVRRSPIISYLCPVRTKLDCR